MTWFGKSLRPVPTNCDTGTATSVISGTGFASANTIGSFAIFGFNSGWSCARYAHIWNTSASVTASSIEPDCDASTLFNSAVFPAFKSVRDFRQFPGYPPLRCFCSVKIAGIDCCASCTCMMTTNLLSARFRPVNLAALIKPANTTTAVPCWSSWKTEYLILLSISLQFQSTFWCGVSSRLMAPKLGAMADRGNDFFWLWTSSTIGTASIGKMLK